MSSNIRAAEPPSPIDIIIIQIFTHDFSLFHLRCKVPAHACHGIKYRPAVPDGIREFGGNLVGSPFAWLPGSHSIPATSGVSAASPIDATSLRPHRRSIQESRALIGIPQRQGRHGRYPPQRSGYPASGRGMLLTCDTIHRERVRTGRNLKGRGLFRPMDASPLVGGIVTNRGDLGRYSSQSISDFRNYRLEASNISVSAPV